MRKTLKPMSQSRKKRMTRIVSVVIALFLAVTMVAGSLIYFFV